MNPFIQVLNIFQREPFHIDSIHTIRFCDNGIPVEGKLGKMQIFNRLENVLMKNIKEGYVCPSVTKYYC